MGEVAHPNPLVGRRLLLDILEVGIGVVVCWRRKLGVIFILVNNKRYKLIEKFPINESRYVLSLREWSGFGFKYENSWTSSEGLGSSLYVTSVFGAVLRGGGFRKLELSATGCGGLF